jgi:subtilisin family serine protease
MREPHVILRSTASATGDPFLGRSFSALAVENSLASIAAGGLVEVEDLDQNEAAEVRADPATLAFARSVPMRLITPVEDEDAVQPAADAVEWGVKAVGADTSPFSGDGIVVAVLDTGIDDSHPAFAGVDIVQEDFTGEGNGDQHGHGTHCAGTIFGRTADGQRIGVAPGVKRALIGKVLGAQGGSSDQIAKAIQWAVDNGANVVSMSLGIDFPGLVERLQEEAGFPPALATSLALEGYRTNVQLFERLASLIRARAAFGQAAVTVAAAGNESRRDEDPNFEIAVSPPAVAEGVVSVAALGEGTQGLTVAPFSNTGANVSGPGVRIVSARPGGGLTTMSGTSMATPHIAGLAALWAERIESTSPLSTLELTSRLIGSATTDGLRAGLDPSDIGAGLVRAPQQR